VYNASVGVTAEEICDALSLAPPSEKEVAGVLRQLEEGGVVWGEAGHFLPAQDW